MEFYRKKGGDKLILDSYIPDDGTYVLVEPVEGGFKIADTVEISLDKKTGECKGRTNLRFNDICYFDYWSKLIEMNKPMDMKKQIHSNNYLSFFIKKETLLKGNGSEAKLTSEIIENYYKILSNPQDKYSSQNAKVLYDGLEKDIGKPDTEKIAKIQKWIIENIFDFKDKIEGKGYLKIFFIYPKEDYEREGKRYFIPNIYNNNDCNMEVDEYIYGLPNNNMGLNAKKPYLENKTRGVTVPYLIDSNEILMHKKMFDYFDNINASGKSNVFFDCDKNTINTYENGDVPKEDFNGVFLKMRRGKKEAEIYGYDVISGYKYQLKKPFEYKNMLKLDLANTNFGGQAYLVCNTVDQLQKVINEVLFSKYLSGNYFSDPSDIPIKDNNVLKSNLVISRAKIFDWIYKGIDRGIPELMDKVTMNIIKSFIERGYIPKASHQLNLRWSIKKYFSKEDLDMGDIVQEIRSIVREKINSSGDVKCDDIKEYYYCVGQLVSFFISKNKSAKRVHSLANEFISAKSDEVLKEKLKRMFKKYNFDIDYGSKRFNNLYSMVAGYEANEAIDADMIIVGYLNNNLIYEKKED